jgi:hypothetical protein
MTEALKACPFCGECDIRQDHPSRAPRVYCSNCRATSQSPLEWNQRVTLSATAMQQALEALRDLQLATHDLVKVTGKLTGFYSVWKAAGDAELRARAAIPALEAAMQPGEEEEVERVARAIYEAQCEIRPGYKMDIELLSLDGRDEWRSVARAAIAAMGEG